MSYVLPGGVAHSEVSPKLTVAQGNPVGNGPPACTLDGGFSSNVLVGLEHLTTGGDTVSPDLDQIGQTSIDLSGQGAGGDGSRMTGNGVHSPGWSVNDLTLGHWGRRPGC